MSNDLTPPPTAVVLRLQPLGQFRELRAHVFPSAESMRWYLRRHRAALIKAGAICAPTGRWLVDPVAFDAYFLANSTGAARDAA